jgi:hypothetical protein
MTKAPALLVLQRRCAVGGGRAGRRCFCQLAARSGLCVCGVCLGLKVGRTLVFQQA